MKKIALYSLISLFIFCFNVNNKLLAQYSVALDEDPSSAVMHSKELSAGKSLLIFKSTEQLDFDSSTENLSPAEYKNGLYFVDLSSGSHAFSVIFNDLPTYLNFDQKMDVNSLPALKEGEIKFYNVTIKPELEWSDITDNEKKRGTFITPLGPNVSDALLVIRLFPSDLELEIKESNNLISKLEKEGSSYNIYIKMPSDNKFDNYKFIFSTSETDDLVVKLPRFEPKSVKFIRIRKPLVESETKEKTLAQTQKNKPNLDKNLIGYWAGSLEDNKTYIDFSEFDDVKKSVKGKIFSGGIYREFKGVTRFKSIDDYQMSLYLIKDDFFPSAAKIDLSFKSGVLNGVWIDDSGQIKDISVMRSSSINPDNSQEIKQKITKLNKKLSGSWKTSTQNKIFDKLIVGKFKANFESEIHFFKDGNEVSTIDSKLLKSNDALTLIATNLKIKGNESPLTFSMTLKRGEANSTLISDNGNLINNIQLERNVDKYSFLNQKDFIKIKNLFEEKIEEITSGQTDGKLNFKYEINFTQTGKNKSDFIYKDGFGSEFQFKFEDAVAKANISPSMVGDKYTKSNDSILVNLSWQSSKENIVYNAKSQTLSSNFKALNLPYGRYKTDIKVKELNGHAFYDQRILKYNPRGPLNAINSMILPGWGTRRVTYNEKSGWGRFAMVAVPLLTSLTFGIMSRNNFDNYRKTDALVDSDNANNYYSKANKQRRTSLIFAGVGAAAYVFNISWVINQGIKNKKNKKKVNNLIKQEDGLYLKRQPIKL